MRSFGWTAVAYTAVTGLTLLMSACKKDSVTAPKPVPEATVFLASGSTVADRVGDKRLRAGLPASWRIGDKTGSGDHGTANTIAIIRPPGAAPIIAAVYYTESSAPMEARNAIHKEIGTLIAQTF